jgi:hypothetical protein
VTELMLLNYKLSLGVMEKVQAIELHS